MWDLAFYRPTRSKETNEYSADKISTSNDTSSFSNLGAPDRKSLTRSQAEAASDFLQRDDIGSVWSAQIQFTFRSDHPSQDTVQRRGNEPSTWSGDQQCTVS